LSSHSDFPSVSVTAIVSVNELINEHGTVVWDVTYRNLVDGFRFGGQNIDICVLKYAAAHLGRSQFQGTCC